MNKLILYFDMDGVVADFDKAIEERYPHLKGMPDPNRKNIIDEYCEIPENQGIFDHLELIDGAMEAFNELYPIYDIYFLSTAKWSMPECWKHKRLWLARHFGERVIKRLILTHRKDLAIGHYLVDDRKANGAAEFKGKHIHFGTMEYPDWPAVVAYLNLEHAIHNGEHVDDDPSDPWNYKPSETRR